MKYSYEFKLMCVAKPGTVRTSRMLDVRLKNLPGSGRIIKNDSQVHLFHGTAELLAKVVLFGQEELKPGESCYAQLRLTEPIATKNGNHFVIRFFSPLETIGGGVILDDQPRRHKRSDPKIQEILKLMQIYTTSGIELPITEHVMEGFPSNERAEAKQVLESLITSGYLILLTPQICLYRDVYASILAAAKTHFEANDSLTLAQLRDMLNTSRKYAQALVEYFDKIHITKKDGDIHYLDQGF